MMNFATFAVSLFLFSVQVRAFSLNLNEDPDCLIQQYWPDMYNCSRFYECDSSHEKEGRECPIGTLWNQKILTCDIPQNVDCSYTLKPTTPTTTTPTTTTPTTTTPTTTTTTPTTTTTTPTPTTTTPTTTTTTPTTTTPTTTTTTPTTTTTTPTTTTPTTTTPTTTRTTTTRQPFTTLKPECTSAHQYFPYPYDCSKYYECSNYKAVLMECPPGELWDNEHQTCDWSFNVDCVTCYVLGKKAENSTDFPKIIVDFDEKCTDGQHHYHSYPYDCKKYCACENQTFVIKDCPSGFAWNEAIRSCDVRDNVNCTTATTAAPTTETTTTTITTTESTTPTTSAAPQTTQKIDCSNEHQAYPCPYDCSKYYQCSGNRAYLMSCPIGEYWNDAEKVCDSSENVDCVATSTPTTTQRTKPPIPTTPKPTPTPKVECTSEHDQFPDPYDCTKYYLCSRNFRPFQMSCPQGMFWNDAEKICDLSANVDCIPSTPSSFAQN